MLRLFNTFTRTVEDVTPVQPGRIAMYSCGPTVYRPAHVGNLRTFLLADVLRRVLRYSGLDVTSVMNITDVGHMTDELTDTGRDRMLLAAEDEGRSAEEIADAYTARFLADCDALGIARFDHYPKASEHVPQMIELISRLVDNGHAYLGADNVYFDVTSFPGYGKLSGQSLDDMRAGYRLETVDPSKRNHQDFVLWRSAGDRRVVVFDSPWGPGFPGWHIECSAMSMHLLGERFDIHTGGVDNTFPHHEDEIAQSEAAVGHRVVSTWVHGEHLLTAGARMAKSSGNVITVGSLRDAGFDPLAFRYLCFTARYRRQFHFADDAMEAAATALRRLREQVALLGPDPVAAAGDGSAIRAALGEPAARRHDAFVAALEDDLDLPSAVRVVHETLADGTIPAPERRTLALSWDAVLGLELAGAEQLSGSQEDLLRERESARSDGDYARADAIREQLRSDGIEVLDTERGTTWLKRTER